MASTFVNDSPAEEERFRAEGRVRVDAAYVTNANGPWFKPGNGRCEWFKDIEPGPEMMVVPAGRFLMGSTPAEISALGRANCDGETGAFSDGSSEAHPDGPDWWRTEGPHHTVSIALPFAAGRHAITRGQYAAFVNDSGHMTESGAYVWKGGRFEHNPAASWRAPGFAQEDRHPVVCISWNDARAYAAWLSSKCGHRYRLLSEAEREYVTRAGTTTAFWWGASISKGDANYNGNETFEGGAKGLDAHATVPVETFAANPWGLFQVHGNIWEWCEDRWHASYRGAPHDGSAWTASGSDRRVIRGGSWVLFAQLLRAANRLYNPATGRSHDLGFRLARTL